MTQKRKMTEQEVQAEVQQTNHTPDQLYILGKHRFIGQANGTLKPIVIAPDEKRYETKKLLEKSVNDGDRVVSAFIKKDLKGNSEKIVIQTALLSSGNKSAISISRQKFEEINNKLNL